MNAIDYGKLACDTIMADFKPANLRPLRRFHYHQGVFLSGMEKIYLATGEEKYYNYIKEWADFCILPDGEVKFQNRTELDDWQASRLLFNLYKTTGKKQYKMVLDRAVQYITNWPVTEQGGFWHMYDKPHQMWLDGLYMAGSVLVPYAAAFGREDLFDLMHRQMTIMFQYLRDEKTGLLYHACDFSKNMDWSDPTTGRSSIFWGRAMGWVALEIVDMLDDIPAQYPKRQDFVDNLASLLKAICNYQDKNSGLWYQVVDRPGTLGNWTEASCSALFTYAIHKAVRLGYLEAEYAEVAKRGYQGLIVICTPKVGHT
ncbi:glycoside hydrolase family 88/105 protein [Ructibacterium gallinarum]|uniref:Glycoside hydrolase family 88 protein n=1 Tax=Ructibacterium gallinarum TaxID=2779355 RepID=A0A9D5M1X6_9FIRM|nr:glycoside hydrolase family 88 protein [Ructibacterium gallinarum]MBE5040800.1 glycoside hydrolase family 88 protein [Ructibacterium gallinarum]